MNVSLKGDRMTIGGTTYTMKSLDRLQGNLHPKCFAHKSDDKALVFGGILSEWHTFSNWATVKVVHNGIVFPTLEHAYFHTQAITFGDLDSAAAILAAPNAQSVKLLSYSTRGVDKDQWNGMKQGVMKMLLKLKFSPGSDAAHELIATGNKKLAETGRNPFYACGMPITDKQVLDTSKWSGNVLGKLLCEIRDELRA